MVGTTTEPVHPGDQQVCPQRMLLLLMLLLLLLLLLVTDGRYYVVSVMLSVLSVVESVMFVGDFNGFRSQNNATK